MPHTRGATTTVRQIDAFWHPFRVVETDETATKCQDRGHSRRAFGIIFTYFSTQQQSRSIQTQPARVFNTQKPKNTQKTRPHRFFFRFARIEAVHWSPLGPGRFLTSCPTQYVQISEKIDPFEPPWTIWVSSTFKSVVFARCWLFRGKSRISNTLKR